MTVGSVRFKAKKAPSKRPKSRADIGGIGEGESKASGVGLKGLGSGNRWSSRGLGPTT